MPHILAPAAARSSPLLAGLSDVEKEDFIRGGRVRAYKSGEPLFIHGDAIDAFYLICSGTVRVFSITPDGDEATSDMANTMLGEAEVFSTLQTHQVNAVAVDDVVVLEFPRAWIRENTKRYGIFALNVLGAMSAHTYISRLEAEQQSTMTAPQRVACFLRRLCVLYDLEPSAFELPYSKTLLASRLGIELETFSRTLAKLREHGIEVQGSRVMFTDTASVEDYTCAHCSAEEDCQTRKQIEKKVQKKKA